MNKMRFQRSKVLWAMNGDKISKFFHNRGTQRKRKNSIQKIQDVTRAWTSNPKEVAQCLIGFYLELFISDNLQQNEAATNSINRVISDNMNA